MLGLTVSNALLGSTLTLASGWARVDTTVDPGPRNGFAMAHVDGRVLLMGGHVFEAGARGDLWELRDGNWRLVSDDDDEPGPRWNHALSSDGVGVLLLGGEDDATGTRRLLGDAWRWQQSWAIEDGDGPSARARHALAYDQVRHRVVLFGGAIAGDTAGDTWEWNPDTGGWTEHAATGPSPRRDHAMAFDGERVVLFGGLAEGYLGDTWTFDGVTWTRVDEGPSPRSGHAMAGGDGLVIVYGGQGQDTIYDDTWIWTGAWQRVPAQENPGRRFGHAMVWAGDHVVLFGGNTPAPDAETWIYTPDANEVPGEDEGGSTDDGATGETDASTDAPDADGEGSGCSCSLEPTSERPFGLALLVVGLVALGRRRNQGVRPCAR